MNRTLNYINLLGVLALGVLCVAQWRLDHQLNQEIGRLENVRVDQATKLDDRDKTIKAQAGDLSLLREHLTRVTADLKTTEGRLRKAEFEIEHLTTIREQLKDSLAKWTAAVNERDQRIKDSNEQIKQLAKDCNEAVTRFNELAGKYNKTVEDLNERTRAYNEMVERYNKLAESRK